MLERVFQIVVLKKTLESPLNYKEIQPVQPKGNQSWIFIERTDGDAEAPIFWPPGVKSWLVGKTLRLGKTESKRRREQQKMRWVDGTSNSVDPSLSKLSEIVIEREAWCATVHGVTKSLGHDLVTKQQQHACWETMKETTEGILKLGRWWWQC